MLIKKDLLGGGKKRSEAQDLYALASSRGMS